MHMHYWLYSQCYKFLHLLSKNILLNTRLYAGPGTFNCGRYYPRSSNPPRLYLVSLSVNGGFGYFVDIFFTIQLYLSKICMTVCQLYHQPGYVCMVDENAELFRRERSILFSAFIKC